MSYDGGPHDIVNVMNDEGEKKVFRLMRKVDGNPNKRFFFYILNPPGL